MQAVGQWLLSLLVASSVVFVSPMALACAVCAAADPTINAPGAEQPFQRRLRISLELMSGNVREGTPDARILSLTDQRVAATVSYAPVRDVLLSLVVPVLHRDLSGAGEQQTIWTLGDLDLRAYGVAWRDVSSWRRSFGLFGGLKTPTAPLENDSRGIPLPAELQPGCSSLVPYLGASYSLGRGIWSGQLSAALYLPFSVRSAPHPGYSMRAVSWLQMQPVHALATRVGLTARADASGELSPGVADLNSGGVIGYVTTDVLVSPTADLVLSLGALFPAAQALLGEHREGTILSARVGYDF